MTTQIVEVPGHSLVETNLEESQRRVTANETQQYLVRHVPAGTGPAYWGPESA